MPIFWFAITNHPRRTLYYFSLHSMHTYLPIRSSYSGYPPFCMAFVNSNHKVVLHFKKINYFIPAPPIDGWWLRKSSSGNKNMWLQSLENRLWQAGRLNDQLFDLSTWVMAGRSAREAKMKKTYLQGGGPVDRQAGRVAGRDGREVTGRLSGWLAGTMAGWKAGWKVSQLVDRQVRWQVHREAGRQVVRPAREAKKRKKGNKTYLFNHREVWREFGRLAGRDGRQSSLARLKTVSTGDSADTC
ncbi:hypothetical protein PPACK8108_LOCUS1942 [Phakopsora pachyrhizi]|uniref:Uncharacterized protein n=1 Tax=Phakopsora pachyrhizi TaxID=170000 RepID=A0AAV0AJ51_PHAPC|nr:hypothetical protein PPACK8108_LOCUS1942 [Phakopsora pachyrhizi]